MDLAEVRGAMSELTSDLIRAQAEAKDLRDLLATVDAANVELMSRAAQGSSSRRRRAGGATTSITQQLEDIQKLIADKEVMIQGLLRKFDDLRAQEDALEKKEASGQA